MKREAPKNEPVEPEESGIGDLPPRERVLRTALALFYEHGVNSVGIDRIIAESGVAKMTFYRHFPSKGRLVAEYLAIMDQSWRKLRDGFCGDETRPALERLLGIFDALAFATRDPGFRGCPFIKGLAEFGPERDEPEVKQLIAAHFADDEKLVTKLLKEIRPKDSKRFIQPLMCLITGTAVFAHATGRTDVADKNKGMVRTLLSG